MTVVFRMTSQVACYAQLNFSGMMMSALYLLTPVALTYVYVLL